MIYVHLLIALPNGCARYRPPEGGTTVTITGTNFTGATAVRFGAANAASFRRQQRHGNNRSFAAGVTTPDRASGPGRRPSL
jgi:hypothetical protein